jgi:hypothetical protein
VGIPSEAEREDVDLSRDWSIEVSGVWASRASVGRVEDECEEWCNETGRDGTKRSSLWVLVETPR